MRLFGKIDNQINRFDRAGWGWVSWPFDLAWSAPAADVEMSGRVIVVPRMSGCVVVVPRMSGRVGIVG